jgi:hypothetical protein
MKSNNSKKDKFFHEQTALGDLVFTHWDNAWATSTARVKCVDFLHGEEL